MNAAWQGSDVVLLRRDASGRLRKERVAAHKKLDRKDPKAVEMAVKLRRAGLAAGFSYKSGSLAKQLKEASAQSAKRCIIIGQELAENNELVIKDMASGEQTAVNSDEFFSRLKG